MTTFQHPQRVERIAALYEQLDEEQKPFVCLVLQMLGDGSLAEVQALRKGGELAEQLGAAGRLQAVNAVVEAAVDRLMAGIAGKAARMAAGECEEEKACVN